MKLKFAAVAFALSSMASVSFAAPVLYSNTQTFDLGSDPTSLISQIVTHNKGVSFLDTFNFSLEESSNSLGSASALLRPVSTGALFNIKEMVVSFYKAGATPTFIGSSSGGSEVSYQSADFLSIGNYYFTVAGKTAGASPFGSYLFKVDNTPTAMAAVPEPETYAMMLAGLGLLGFAARRKAKAQA